MEVANEKYCRHLIHYTLSSRELNELNKTSGYVRKFRFIKINLLSVRFQKIVLS